MASKVKLPKGKEFTFKQTSGGGGESKYPWDEWLNGELLLLERSEGTENEKGTIEVITTKRDFEVPRDAMPAKLKTAARRRYKVVQISKRDADGNRLENEGLIIRARDMNDEERAEEDILRAEEKDASIERRKNRRDTSETVPTA